MSKKVKIMSGRYDGWKGVLNGVVGRCPDRTEVVSVSICPPPYTDSLSDRLLSHTIIWVLD